MGTVDRMVIQYGDGKPPSKFGPPKTNMELRRLIDYLNDRKGFEEWFKRIVMLSPSTKV